MYKYMKYLGYSYCSQKKSYYNDGHQRPEQVEYRKQFVQDYFDQELRSYVWVQLPESDAMVLESGKDDPLMKDIYYSFVDDAGQAMREYHVDAHPSFCELVAPQHQQFGGNASVRRQIDERPAIVIGQDESAFSQYSFNEKMWKGPSGESKLLPKGMGKTLMVSAFQSRAFGLGRGLSTEELEEINNRREGTEYISVEAAMQVNNETAKPRLTNNSPFLRFFDVGVDREGYWDYNHMALQTEDLLDCLLVLFPNHDFVFLFDQSSGHCKRAADGLQAGAMNSSWGGKQPAMRSTVIEADCLGKFSTNLKIGDTQSMVFGPNDAGPFNMKPHVRAARKHNRIKGQAVKRYTKDELLKQLIADGFRLRKRYTKKELDDIATGRGLALQREVDITEEGWLGKPKGALQIAFERGFINTELPLSSYSLAGKDTWKDENGDLLQHFRPFCLRSLLGECPDFRNEKSALQNLVEAYSTPTASCQVLFTPKYHCEIAGEGIEYLWAFAKRVFCAVPYLNKHSSDGFRSVVRDSIATATISNARKFCGKARRYMLAYSYFDRNEDNPTFDEIEKFVKHKAKTHRNVADSDVGFISQAVRASIHI
jgi:hypothetical protein